MPPAHSTTALVDESRRLGSPLVVSSAVAVAEEPALTPAVPRTSARWLYPATACVSAVLLFSLQPVVARAVVPSLGGSPAVWTTCVLFFQASLLAAYLYAHVLTRVPSFPVQTVVHLGLLGLAALLLPDSLAGASSRLAAAGPDTGKTLLLLQVLAVSVGPVAFAVSATGPLVQAWLLRARAVDPYYVYAFSNAGSLGALLAYPILIEPATTLRQQFGGWGVGFWGFAALMAALAAISLRPGPGSVANPAHAADDPSSPAVGMRRRLLWIGLAAVPSSLMLGLTAYLSTDIASVPLLWVVPCALYLATLIVPFSGIGPAAGRIALASTPIVVPAVVTIQTVAVPSPTVLFMALHLAAFVAAALACHTVLAARRPDGRRLTDYYVCVALGGVLGSAVNSLIAPWLFRTVAEYPLMLIAGLVLPAWAGGQAMRTAWRGYLATAAAAASIIAVVLFVWDATFAVRMALLAGVPLAFCFATRHPGLQAGVVVTLLVLPFAVAAKDGEALHVERSFFGVHRVLALDDGSRVLQHGTTIHGRQMRTGQAPAREPASYYYRGGPFGDVDQVSAGLGPTRRVAVAGLGAGTLAAYARPRDRWTFYEIDPAVERIARNPAFFTYLPDCAGACGVVLGDARISLRAEPAGAFDLLVFDVFSSDAIPVHMLTVEAIGEYRARLRSGGVMAFHVSNRYLDLAPVLARGASAHGLVAMIKRHSAAKSAEQEGGLSSDWLVMAESPAALAPFAARGWTAARPADEAWTDDFSNVLAVVRWRGRGAPPAGD